MFDTYYLLLVVPAMLLALWAQSRVQSTYRQYSAVLSDSGLTARQAAERVLELNGVQDVRFERTGGQLTDHYDPRSNTIRLSGPVEGSRSVAAIGVACHEAGHAVQYARQYGPIRLRNGLLPVAQLGSSLAFPLILLGIFIDMGNLINFGLLLFGGVALFQLVTLPVEFDASRRAIAALEGSGMMSGDELYGAKKVLSAAAMTYVAALLTALAQLLRLVLLFGGRGRRND
ncbi:MAG: zinc metallopeptidase [Clostridiales bacterium]|nr:zinc metallopeptidase [Clostridiales bacterium]